MHAPIKNIVLLLLMLAASGMALALRPTQRIADAGLAIKLEEMIPRNFGQWHEQPQHAALIVDPQQKEMVDQLYAQTLSRTYVNDQGYRIMLSIAYGTDQTDANQVHKPEVCYPAQGFVLKSKQYGTYETGSGPIPITRIDTSQGLRNEPVTYWITVGDQVVGPGLDKKLAELGYGLAGRIPDGLLFRVSSIDGESARAYGLQDEFIGQLLASLDPASRAKFIGNPKREQP